MRISLDDVSARLGDGRYNLDRWRRILTYMKPKAFAKAITADSCFKKNPSTGRLLGLTPAAIAELSGSAAKARLLAQQREQAGISNLVDQLQQSKAPASKSKEKSSRKPQRPESSDSENEGVTDKKKLQKDNQSMINEDEGLVAPDDETYTIYN